MQSFRFLIIPAEDIQSEFTLVPGDKFNLSLVSKGHYKVFVVCVLAPFDKYSKK